MKKLLGFRKLNLLAQILIGALLGILIGQLFPSFAKAVADRIVFMDSGEIVETNYPLEFFRNPKTERAKKFLNIFNFEKKDKVESALLI